jgi:hypothetical protein
MLWTLDTCGFNETKENCQIEIAEPWTFVGFVRKCPAHQNVPDNQAGMDIVHQENRRGKGNALSAILEAAPSTLFDTLADGTRDFKRGINVSWSWSGVVPDRVLNVNISGVTLTTNQQNTARNFVNNRFGVGKVLLTFG